MLSFPSPKGTVFHGHMNLLVGPARMSATSDPGLSGPINRLFTYQGFNSCLLAWLVTEVGLSYHHRQILLIGEAGLLMLRNSSLCFLLLPLPMILRVIELGVLDG